MKVLAIDPGFERLGIAVVEKIGSARERVPYSDCFRTSATLPFDERLALIGIEIERLLAAYEPDIVALETLYFSNNQKTAMRVAEVRGVILYLAKRSGKKIREYTPGQIKSAATGFGGSNKQQVITMIERLVELPKKARLDDEYDAIAIGITCLASQSLEKALG